MPKNEPKILILDVETAPIEMFAWGVYGENTGITMLKQDWSILAYCAKWYGSKTTVYRDTSKQKDVRDDKAMLKDIWNMIDEADVILTQNGKRFDEKKLNARFIINGYNPPSPYQHIDTKQMANKRFGFTSASLEYMCSVLDVKYKKLKHKEFPGFELWRQCLLGNKRAWAEMKLYNVHDVLALECVYDKLKAWGNQVDMAVYSPNDVLQCSQCGSQNINKKGFSFTRVAKRQKYQCQDCKGWTCSKVNLLTLEKKKAVRR